MSEFKKELEQLINEYSIESIADMPDFLLAEMICNMIDAMGPSIKKTLDWHGCSSVCHPRSAAPSIPITLVQKIADGCLAGIEGCSGNEEAATIDAYKNVLHDVWINTGVLPRQDCNDSAAEESQKGEE